MKKITMLLMAAMLTLSHTAAQAAECSTDLAPFFKTSKGCFLLYNLTKKRYDISYGGAACDKPMSPASTFKIPNSLIGLDTGVLEDENTSFSWDHTKQPMESWQQDHTLASAVQNSVVWYFKMVAKEVGEEEYTRYLKLFNYGNRDISSGLTNFWLGKSLKISPKGQINFLKKLYLNTLPVTTHASDIVKKILILESASDNILSGKTGSASVDGTNIGWFIGHLKSGETEYLFATNITQKGTDYKIDNEYAGLTAKAMTKNILACQKLF